MWFQLQNWMLRNDIGKESTIPCLCQSDKGKASHQGRCNIRRSKLRSKIARTSGHELCLWKKKWARSTSRSNRDQMCFDSKLDGVRINGKWKKLSRNIIYRWKEKDGRTMINSRIHRLNIEQKNKRVSILASACNLRNLHIYRMSLFDNKSVDTTDSCLFANYNSPWLILTN